MCIVYIVDSNNPVSHSCDYAYVYVVDNNNRLSHNFD